MIKIINQAILLILLLFSFYYVRYIYKKISFEKCFLLSLAVAFAIIQFLGYTLDLFKIKFEPYYLLVFFIPLIILIQDRKKNRSEITFSKSTLFFFLLMAAIFYIYLYPSLPYFSQPCTNGDCYTHLLYTNRIFDTKLVRTGIEYESISLFRGMGLYPLGAHVTSAVLSHLIGTHPFIFMYILMAFLTALTIMAAFLILKNYLPRGIMPYLLPILLILSTYPREALILFGFWAQVAGIFFILIFILIMIDFYKEPSNRLFILLLISTAGLIFSYTLYLSVIVLTFLAAILFANLSKKLKLIYSIIFVLFTFIISLFFLIQLISNIPYLANSGGYTVYKDITLLFPIFYILGLIGAYFSHKNFGKTILPLTILLIIILLHLSLYFLPQLTKYWSLKYPFLLIYPILIFSIITISKIYSISFLSSFKKFFIPLSFTIFFIIFLVLNSKSLFISINVNTEGMDMWNESIKGSFVYQRTGNNPELLPLRDWLLKNANSNETIFYAGHYSPCYLQGLTRYKIYADKDSTGRQFNLQDVREDMLIFKHGESGLYRKQLSDNSAICY